MAMKNVGLNRSMVRKIPSLDTLDASGKRVLVRLDLNLPFHKGKITDLTRLQRALSTVKDLVASGAKVIIMAHLGRPKGIDKSLSLAPIAKALQEAMTPTPVFFCKASQGLPVTQAIQTLKNGQVLVLENIRFNEGEEKNDPAFVKEMASWGDAYVNDAFSIAHRSHASTEGIAHFLPSYAGRLMVEELSALASALTTPRRPLMAIIGGAKISTKLSLLENIIPKVDVLVVGGAMANTLLAAQGYDVGASLYEPALLDVADEILRKGPHILLPEDCVVAKDLEDSSSHEIRLIKDIRAFDKIFDIGPVTVAKILDHMKTCHTLLWNGPLGVFEVPPFDQGTLKVAQGAAQLTKEGSLLSVAGGGETVAALTAAHVIQDFTYVSTAGGAFLAWLEGKSLPGVEALRR